MNTTRWNSWKRPAQVWAGTLLASALGAVGFGAAPSAPRLFEWERGFGLRIAGEPTADMFYWIYEWNMFEAMQPGQHTQGTYKLPRKISADGTKAIVESPEFRMELRAVADGATAILRITNTTEQSWPEIAGVIPCWNPGQIASTSPSKPQPLNRNFADPMKRNSWYLSSTGLVQLDSRALHFNARYRAAAETAAKDGQFAWSSKWPTSPGDAVAGLLIRESEDGRWVTGVAWEEFLSVQGHNPWYCLHGCIRVGPLRPGESRTIRGRLYLFAGNKADCLARFQRDFPAERALEKDVSRRP